MKNIAYILLFVFSAFLIAPSAIVLVKSSIDISYVYTVNEEENNHDRVEVKDKEVKLSSLDPLEFFSDYEDENHLHDYKENYKHVFFDVLSPPPEHV